MPRKRVPKANATKLFRDRIEREGRLPEWKLLWAEQTEGGKSPAGALHVVMRAMGYVDADHERALHEKWAKSQPGYMDEQARMVEEQSRQRKEAFDAARVQHNFLVQFGQLPTEVKGLPPDLEFVYTHPAMMRALMATEEERESFVVKAEDIANATNGGAASMLQHFCRHPNEFYKQVLDKWKKDAVSDAKAGGPVTDSPADLDEIRSQLKKVQSRNKEASYATVA